MLPHREVPEHLPHGADVLVFGCPNIPQRPKKEHVCLYCFTNGFDVMAAVIYGDDREGIVDVLWRDGEVELFTGCPLPQSER